IRKGEGQGMDGYVVACFGDPGLLACREVARGPVLGIAEAAMHAASFVATGFSIVTTLARTRVIAAELVERYGMTRLCRSIRATDLPVLDLEREGSQARRIGLGEGKRAIAGAGEAAMRLGCAVLRDLTSG